MVKKNNLISRALALFTILILVSLMPAVSASTRFGDRYCYRQGSLWYCARYDYSSFYSGTCAGTVQGPHLNLEIMQGSTNGLYYGSLQNWHIGWKQYNSDQCLISYEPTLYKSSHAAGCIKVCYQNKSAKAGDILPRIGFPSFQYDYQISNVLNRLNIAPGYSPYSWQYPLAWLAPGSATIVAAGTTFLIVSIVMTTALQFALGM